MKTQTSRYLFATLLFINLFFLASCGVGGLSENSLHTSTGHLKVKFPASLEKILSDEKELRANITLDGSDTQMLTVDREKKQITGGISGISPGTHLLTLVYIVIENGEEVKIASATAFINVSGGEVVALIFDDLIYFDEDGDGVTNIAELDFGTDPDDYLSRPNSHGIRGSVSYAVRDKVINHSAVAGVSRGQDYSIR